MNDHDRDAAVSIDAATTECSVTKTGRTGGWRRQCANTALSIARAVKKTQICSEGTVPVMNL